MIVTIPDPQQLPAVNRPVREEDPVIQPAAVFQQEIEHNRLDEEPVKHLEAAQPR